MGDFLKGELKNLIKKGLGKIFTTKVKLIMMAGTCGIAFTFIIFMVIIGVGGSENEEVYDENLAGMQGTSDEQWEQLVRFIRCMEGGDDKVYKNSRGEDCYMVLADGGISSAVIGVDMTVHGEYFRSLGYSTSIGSLIPKDLAVAKFEEELRGNYDYASSKFSAEGLNLTQYQLFAFTSRAFNCGDWGSFNYCEESPQSCIKNYWKQSRDDKFKKTKEPDYSNGLYTKCMHRPTTSGSTYLAGLELRRKAEYRLFQCGWYKWYDMMDEQFIEESSYAGGDAGDILATAERIHKYMEDHKYTYYGTYASTFEGSKQYKACVCASLVSWVLIDCGYINTCYHDCGNLDNLLASNSKFERINKVKNVSQLKAGDILIYEDYWPGGYGRVHTEIYAGNNTIYNAGSTNALQRENPYYKDMQAELNRRPVTRVYRLKESARTYRSGSSSANISSGGYDSIYTSSITGKKFKEFKQNSTEYRYPSIPSNCSWSSECGTVSTLIVGSGYNNKLTLQDAANRLHATGGSTNIIGYTAYFTGKSVEAESTPISVSSMTKHLKKGDVAVIHNPGYSGNGHYLALLDISKDGKEVYISNPDVYGGKTGGYNGATKQGWNSISKVCSALNETVDWVKK